MMTDIPELCSDCPPVGYPTDKTRCLPCPRRADGTDTTIPEARDEREPEPVEALVKRLHAKARAFSDATKMMAEAKSRRNSEAEGEECHYQGLEPEQTDEWFASEALATLLSERTRMEGERDEMRRERDEARAKEGKFWLELREPGCVPERKGPWPLNMTASVLREFMDARPGAFITVITEGHDGPDVQDGPECLQMTDARSMERGRRHIKSSSAAHASSSTLSATVERLTAENARLRDGLARLSNVAEAFVLHFVLNELAEGASRQGQSLIEQIRRARTLIEEKPE